MSYLAPISIEVPEAFEGLWSSTALVVLRGGRGGAKSWEIARYLVVKAAYEPHRILCAREFQTSIADSVHKLLVDTIDRLGMRAYFRITDTSISAWATGSEFLFKGLRRNIREIKSTEGITITWVEEGQTVAEISWEILLPTVFRTPGARLIVSYNPENTTDPVDVRFWQNRATYGDDIFAAHVGHEDNPHFPPELEKQRLYMLKQAQESGDFAAYDHIWNGGYRTISQAQIFRGRFKVESFTAPVGTRFHYGMDFGFANDPNALVRGFIDKDRDALMIDYAAFGHGTELDELHTFMEGGIGKVSGTVYPGVPGSKDWPIKADSARPETISFLRRKGFNISAAKKWQGSVEDGIAHLKGFTGGIVIHERCKEMIEEAKLYSFKVDPTTGEVLPIIVDKWNHGWDATRYSLDGFIQRRGAAGVWERLGGR